MADLPCAGASASGGLPEPQALRALASAAALSAEDRRCISSDAEALVRAIRAEDRAGLMELFLEEYGLSTDEGVALMCLAEALPRVPDAETMDDLIEDKIAPSEWGRHLGRSSSSLVNASTWGLALTGRVLRPDAEPGPAATLRGMIRRLGEPVIRAAVHRAMQEMGRQFVLGRDIEEAADRARRREAQGYAYSYDMLGEAARTDADARRYHRAYADAIAALARRCKGDVRDNPGISVKLSALHPRYEAVQRDRVMSELLPRAQDLVRAARRAGMGFNIDAEEADRLDLSLEVIEALLADPELAGWDGFGVVVQAYGKRASATLDRLHALAERLDRRIMVRLVKGAYWDTEIKRAQVLGLRGFPVWTRKAATDVAYIACARKLMGMRGRIYPQFATHNAHTAAAVLHMAGEGRHDWEFQRLHGMGEALHEMLRRRHGTRCRIYAPVGAHRDLLAYLVRRLLENGANSSFVHRIVDPGVPPGAVAEDPFAQMEAAGWTPNPAIHRPEDLFAPERPNSRGWDLADPQDMAGIEAARAPFADHVWQAHPLTAKPASGGALRMAVDPAHLADSHPEIRFASPEDVERAHAGAACWTAPAEDRAAALERAADLYEANFGELFALAAREAGKILPDCIAELREAVDFLRYYAARAREAPDSRPRGTFVCVSPWNFPLAIFTGQIAAALAAGNAVIAKPAEQTSLMAHRATVLLHEAGVPRSALQCLPGTGAEVGANLVADARVAGVAFTGSTASAQAIHRGLARHAPPHAPLIAETGGLNAMIVDSTALPEQAVRDIVVSAFQSAGQRCSALRCLYVQEDVAEDVLRMLKGAMDALVVGDPWDAATDVGPVIDPPAQKKILAHVEKAQVEGRVLHRLPAPEGGAFVGPALIRIGGIEELEEEIFGPVLHVATFRAEALERVVDAVNASGYGLTFGLHTRIDGRVQRVVERIRCGNVYVNRNQIGAIVGSQPFGGEGLSGTGPKAGGPAYVPRFRHAPLGEAAPAPGPKADAAAIAAALASADAAPVYLPEHALPGPTGESNRLRHAPRGPVLCLGPGAEAAAEQARQARALGCPAAELPQGAQPEALTAAPGFAAVAFWGPPEEARPLRMALAAREGPILPLILEADLRPWLTLERHVCIDTTAAGGNAALLAAADGED